MAGNGRSFRAEGAITDVLGSILLVSITVVVSGVFSLLVVHSMNPVERLHADVQASLDAGSGAWGSGDERIWLVHEGGSPLARDLTRIAFTVGTVTTTLDGLALTGPFADGKLTTGERWSTTRNLASCDAVDLRVIIMHDAGSSQLLAHQVLVAGAAGCAGGP